MPQNPKVVFISTRYVTDEEGRYQVAPQPLTPPKTIARSGPGRIVTPAA